jgi:hypothetical protein
LDGLRELRSRIADQRLEPDDWLLVAVLVEKQISRIEGRLERMMAKLAAETAAVADCAENTDDASESVCGVEHSVHDDESENPPAPSEANTPNEAEPAARSAGGNNAEDKRAPEKRKGHGRNGAHAYRKARHFFYALGVGVLGAVCNRCAGSARCTATGRRSSSASSANPFSAPRFTTTSRLVAGTAV